MTTSRDGASTEAAFRALLADNPDALVLGVSDGGVCVPIPDGIPVGDHRVAPVRTALDLVRPDDRSAVIAAWQRGRVGGAGSVAFPGPRGANVLAHMFDFLAPHGVYMVVVVPTDAADDLDQIVERPPPPPRLARAKKNEIGVFLEVGPEITALLGWDPEELIGRRSLDFIHPEDHERATDTWMEALCRPGATGRSRLRHRHRDGQWVWLETANRNLLDDPVGAWMDCEMLDISEEMAAVEAVRASEQLLRRLAGALPVGVIQFGPDLHVVFANEALYRIVGAQPDASESELALRVADIEPVRTAIAGVLVGQDADLDVHIDRRDGMGVRRCTVALRALTDGEGKVSGAVGCLTDVTESLRLRTELERRATYDALTGCVNRMVALATLSEALLDRRKGTAVVFLDLDGFKAINDDLGHGAGDTVLMTVAARLRDAVRGGDVVGRIGGDEFLVICPDVADEDAAMALADRVAAIVSGPLDIGESAVHVRPSVGVAWAGGGGDAGAEAVVALADAAMYESKRMAIGQPVLAGRGAAPRATARDLGSRLRLALADGDLDLHHQEIRSLRGGATVATEALLRWHRQGRQVPAGEFIAVAEASGVICDIGPWVVDEVCRQAAAAARPELSWFMNLSPRELAAPRVLAAVGDALDRHGLDPSLLVVEVTEHSAFGDDGAAARAVAQLVSWGVGIALDDFGTGSSSLATLLTVPARWLKIDRSFVAAMPASPRARALVEGIVELAARIGADTVAEGIETADELAMVEALGIGYGQGYLFSRPRPLAEILAHLPAR